MIYADYNSSAPMLNEVKDYLIQRIQNGPFANPNSIHLLGQKTLSAMENARNLCATHLGADPDQLIFNSGASEGIANVLHSILSRALKQKKNYLIISEIEHSAIMNTAKIYAYKGFNVKILPVNNRGVVNVTQLKKWLEEFGKNTALVSIMAANNETGVIQPIEKIGLLCKKHNIPYFSDTTQYIGKTQFNFNKANMDFAVMSGHKIGAMTGTGLILAKDKSLLSPLIYGGGQEDGLRSGTQNYIPLETLAIALDSVHKNFKKIDKMHQMRTNFESKIKSKFPSVVIFGEKAPRLSNTTFISYPGIHAQAIQIELEANNIFTSTSSACADNEPITSNVLKALGVSEAVGRGAIRISMSLDAKASEYDKIFKCLSKAYQKLSKVSESCCAYL